MCKRWRLCSYDVPNQKLMIFADAVHGAGVDAFDALVYGAEGVTGQTPLSQCADLGGQAAVG